MSEEPVHVVGIDDVDDESIRRSPPPVWGAVVVVLAVVGIGWFFVSQGSPDSDLAATTTSSPDVRFPPDGGEPVPNVTATDTAAEISVRFQAPNSRVSIHAPQFRPGDLAGDVVLTTPLAFSAPASLWVLGPSGTIVTRNHVPIRGGPSRYPLLITSERIVFTNYSVGYVLDAAAVGPVRQLGSATFVIPGAHEGLVWFVRSRSLLGDVSWVAPVDVDTQIVGQQINVADLFSAVVTGAGDGLIVNPIDRETYGEFAYWSPSEGLASLDFDDPDREIVVSGSGDFIVTAQSNRMSVSSISSEEDDVWFSYNLGGTVSSACLSPDQQHLVVVGSNGNAFIANVQTGQMFALDGQVQASHGVGWTSNDQLVYLSVSENGRTLVAHDSDESSGVIAQLDGAGDWWLTASGTMC
jgi:hypothetical protein